LRSSIALRAPYRLNQLSVEVVEQILSLPVEIKTANNRSLLPAQCFQKLKRVPQLEGAARKMHMTA
jgi:hypothetical protein